MKSLWKPLILSCTVQLFIAAKSYAAYTWTWTGGTSTVWELSSNWSKTGTGTSTYPGQGGVTTDIVQIGVSGTFTRQPALNSAVTIASLTMGTTTASTLTINNALTVTGNITLKNNGNTGGITYGLTGTGSISCNNFYLGDSTTPPLPILGLGSYTFLTTLNFSSLNLNITQNLYLTTTSAKTSLVYLLVSFPAASVDNPVFNFSSGIITVGNQVQTVDTNDANITAYLLIFPAVSSSAEFLTNPSAGNTTTLNLEGTNSISLDGNAGYIDLDGTNGGTSTVNYGCTMGQEVYTTSTPYSNTRQSPTGLDRTPAIYPNLVFAGAQTKTADAGNLTVGNNLTLASGTETVDFAANSPIVTVGGNFTSNTGTTLNQGGTGTMAISGTSNNAGTLNQTGSGNITFTGNLNNSVFTAIIAQTGAGSIIASSGITNSGTMSQGSTGTIGNINITGAFINAGTVTQTTGNITVSGGVTNSGTLTLGSANLTVSGNYTNSGIYSQSTGTTLFNGSSAQNMQGGSGAGTLFKTVNFSGSGIKTMSSGNFAVASTSVLTMIGSSTLAASGYLTLNSDANGSATVASMPSGASITGNVNVQRFITGGTGYRGYRLVSSPVTSGSGDYEINYLINSCYLTGTDGIPGGFDKAGNPTLYLYRENIAPLYTTFLNSNYRGINNLSTAPVYGMDDTTYPTTTIPVGNGYLFFFRGDRSVASLATETTTTYVPTSTTLTTTGTLNAGTITVSNWYTPSATTLGYTTTVGNDSVRGYNLVGNPYASSIDWDKSDSTTSAAAIYSPHLTKYIYVLDPISKNYGIYGAGTPSKTGTNNATNIIVSGQGFLVKATGTGAKLVFSESARVNTQVTTPALLMTKTLASIDNQYLRLQLAKDSINADDIVIKFDNTATAQYNPANDAPYLQGMGLVHLCSFSQDNIPLAINDLPLPGKTADVIRLNVTAKTSGVYSLNLTAIEEIPQLYEVWLMDNYKHDSLDMRQNKSYAFNLYLNDTTSFGANRFKLVISQDPAYAYRLLSFTAAKVPYQTQVQTSWNTINEGNYTHFSVERSNDNGKTFNVIGIAAASGARTYSLPDKSPATGENLYRLQQVDVNNTTTYSQAVAVLIGGPGQASDNTVDIYPNPAVGTVNLVITPSTGDPASYDIKFTDSSGIVVKQASSKQATWQGDVSNLLPGTYFVQVLNNKNDAVVGKVKFVKN